MAQARKPKRVPLLEWVSAGVGLVIAVGFFGLLAVEALRQRDGIPPVLHVDPVALTRADGHYFLQLEVSNRSHITGAGVQVEGTLKQGGSDVETSTTTVSFVPGESRRRAGLVFTRDPREHSIELRVTGYEHP